MLKRFTAFDLGWTFFTGLVLGSILMRILCPHMSKLADKIDGEEIQAQHTHQWYAEVTGCYHLGRGLKARAFKGDLLFAENKPEKIRNEECR